MKITKKKLVDIIKEEIEKIKEQKEQDESWRNYLVHNRTFSPPTRSEIEKEPVAGYIMQQLNPWLQKKEEEVKTLAGRIAKLEEKPQIGAAISTTAPGELNENVDNIKKMQKFLKIKQTGIMDDVTKREVIKFQTEEGLDPDGIIGPNTMAAMRAHRTPGASSDQLPKKERIKQASKNFRKNQEKLRTGGFVKP